MISEINETQNSIKDIYDILRGVQSNAAQSVTEATKETQINSAVYVQKNIASLEIAPKLISLLNQIYCSFILTAIGMNQHISGNRTVRDAARQVSTEAYMDAVELTKQAFGEMNISNEAGVVKLVDAESQMISSKVIEVQLSVGGEAETVPLFLTTTLIPRFVTEEVVTSLVSLKYRPSIRDRWAQFTSGEISFWKDFIFCGDILAAEKKGFKSDESGILYEIATNSNNKLSQGLFETLFTGTPRNNLASTMLVVDKNTMKNISTKTHFDWDNYRARQKFFLETASVMIVMVDSMYGLVDVYYNGIKHKGEYTFDMVNTYGSGKVNMDMSKVMQQMAAGAPPQKF